MTANPPEDRVQVNISLDDANDFIQRLASDDDFRSQLQQDPAGVLGQYGIQLPPSMIPDDIVLPSKDDIEDLLERSAAAEAGLPPLPPPFTIFLIIFWVRLAGSA